MGRKAREIIRADPREVIADLLKAYAVEWVAHHLFYTYAQLVRGLDAHVLREELLKAAQEELVHAGRLARRITVLGGRVPASLDEIARLCPFRAPEPPARSTDYRAFVENILEVERNAVALYHEMMGKYHDSDHLTFELAEDLLEAEVEEEERWERILEGL